MTQHAFKPILLDLLRQAQINQNAFFQELPQPNWLPLAHPTTGLLKTM
jgi:hypothetical protein